MPIVQATAATCPRADWEANAGGLFPIDVAMSVAIPEFDGRIISVPFSFKEVVDDGDTLGTPVSAYRTVADRTEPGGRRRACAWRGCAGCPVAERRVAIVLSAYPTKRSRIGNAVALDTPASVIALLRRLRDAGYRVDRIPDDGDALMAELIDTFSYERETLTAAQLGRAAGRWGGDAYRSWFATLPAGVQEEVEEKVGQGAGHGLSSTGRAGSWCSPAWIWATSSSPCSRPAGSGRTRSRSTTRRTCRRPIITWGSTVGWTRAGGPTPSSTRASTAPWSGCRARGWACRRRASPMPRWATCRWSTRSW